MDMSKKMITPIAMGVITIGSVGVGFGGGVWYQKTQLRNNFGNARFTQNAGFNGARMMRTNTAGINQAAPAGGMMGRGAVAGEITAKDDKSITVKMPDGSSRIVILGSDTKYTQSTEASLDKLVVGTTVAVFGTTSNDGTTTATSVEINPALRGQTNK